MDRWVGRVALVTGASSGIGAAICEVLVKNGMKVVGAARRVEKVKELSSKLQSEKGNLIAVKCDLTNDEEVYAMFNFIKEKCGGVDICINNAGMSYTHNLLDGTPEEWRRMTDVNIIALCLCTKLAAASMKERNIDDGHIINVSSVFGHIVHTYGDAHFYAGTKHAVRAITEGVRQEMREAKRNIRVSSISPGLVKTEFMDAMYGSKDAFNNVTAANNVYTYLFSENIASTVLHMISLPPHVEINDVIVRSTGEVF